MTSLTTFQNANVPTLGPVSGSGSATTNWVYDQATGQLATKTFADGSADSLKYNAAGRLTNMTTPTMSAASFQYNNAGEQTWSALYGGIDTIRANSGSTLQG